MNRRRASLDGATLRQALALALRDLRTERGFTQLEFGHKIGLSQTAIARFETAVQSPTFDDFALLARGLRVSRSELLERVESAFKALDDAGAREVFAVATRRARGPRLRQ